MAPGDCCIPPPPADYVGHGKEEMWGSLSAYAVGSPTASSAVLFICDIYVLMFKLQATVGFSRVKPIDWFTYIVSSLVDRLAGASQAQAINHSSYSAQAEGWKVPQTRYLADKIAAHGYYVVLPDFMEDDFFDSTDPTNPYAGLPDYLARHSQSVAVEEAGHVIEQIHGTGFKKLGIVGNCWGGKILVSLLRGDKNVDAAVMNHPSFLTTDDIKAVKVPLALLGASIDIITPPAMALEFGKILAASPEVGDKYCVKIFEGADHGWTTRYDLKDEAAHQMAEEAHAELLEWFGKFLVVP